MNLSPEAGRDRTMSEPKSTAPRSTAPRSTAPRSTAPAKPGRSVAARPVPRHPFRPAIPALRRGSSLFPRLKTISGVEPARYVGAELPGERSLVYTIHDGRGIPAELLGASETALLRGREVCRAYRTERDWGANLVAGHLARHLGLGGYVKVRVARVLLDFGRLPGSSPAGVAHLKRRAVFPPVGPMLAAETIDRVLERCYGGLEAEMTRRLAGKTLSIAIHTYDPLDADGKLRPELSLITGFTTGDRPVRAYRATESPDTRSAYDRSAYDPLFPMDLREAACDPALSRRVISNLERGGREVTLNRPYDLHEGSVELRAQGRFFFRYLRRRFEAAFAKKGESASHRWAWAMLADIARRSSASRVLDGFVHRSRPAPAGLEWTCAGGRRAYREIADFLTAHRAELLSDYRFVHDRPSTLAIEVRKDLLCELDNDGAVAGLRLDAQHVARDLARRLATAVAAYVRKDLAAKPATAELPELARASGQA